MNEKTTFSSVPVGQQFEYKGQIYIRHTYFRGKKEDNTFVYFPKHRMVTWINAWESE